MTLKEIASNLKVSIGTVSKALNGAFDVSEETRKMIVAYCKEVGYKTKDERMTSKKRRRICILFDNMNPLNQSNVFYPLSSAFSNEASKNNCEVIIDSLSVKPEFFDFNEYMQDNKFDGAFIIGLNFESSINKQLANSKYPLVLYDNTFIGDNVSTIGIDNLSTMSDMLNHLVSKGHRKIALLNGEMASLVSSERLAGYIIGLNKNGIPFNSEIVFHGDFTKMSGMQIANDIAKTDVTAVMCSSDLMAIGLIEGLNSLGKKVPEEISVTGFDDLDFAQHIHPALTTVKQDLALMGKNAFELINSLFANKKPQRITIKGEIIIRDSVIDIK